MKKLEHLIYLVESWGIYLCFSISLLSLTFGILTRYVFMRPVGWPDELSTYLFILQSGFNLQEFPDQSITICVETNGG